jgi:hypothetical protein
MSSWEGEVKILHMFHMELLGVSHASCSVTRASVSLRMHVLGAR